MALPAWLSNLVDPEEEERRRRRLLGDPFAEPSAPTTPPTPEIGTTQVSDLSTQLTPDQRAAADAADRTVWDSILSSVGIKADGSQALTSTASDLPNANRHLSGLDDIARAPQQTAPTGQAAINGAIDSVNRESGDLKAAAYQAAAKWGVDPAIFLRQIQRESNFNPSAHNQNSGASGIAQFMPATAAGLNVDPSDPFAALDAAAQYMRQHLDREGGDYRRALASYNWGQGNVSSWDGRLASLPEETRVYLDEILNNRGQAYLPNEEIAALAGGASVVPSVGQGAREADGSLTPNQKDMALAEGLDATTAWAVCGPAAAIAFARRMGRSPSMREALALAVEVGWTRENGMAGTASQQKLLERMGIASKLEMGAPNWDKVRQEVESGNPVIIDAGDHYMVAERYDAATGTFDFGNSASVLRMSKGQRWFRPEDLAKLSSDQLRISPEGAIYLDNPATTNLSPAAGRSDRYYSPMSHQSVPSLLDRAIEASQRSLEQSKAAVDASVDLLGNGLKNAVNKGLDSLAGPAAGSDDPLHYWGSVAVGAVNKSQDLAFDVMAPGVRQAARWASDKYGSQILKGLGLDFERNTPIEDERGELQTVLDPNLSPGESLSNAGIRNWTQTKVAMLGGLAGVARELGLTPIGNLLDNMSDDGERYLYDNPHLMRQRAQDVFDDPVYGIAEGLIGSASSILPSFLGVVLTGAGAYTRNPGLFFAGATMARAGLGAGVLQGYGGTLRELRSEVRDGRMTYETANTIAKGAGLLEYATEKMLPGVDAKLIGKIGKDAAGQMAREMATRGMLKAGRQLAFEMGQEGAEEAISEIYGVAVDYTFKENKPELLTAARRIVNAAVIGGISGGISSAPSMLTTRLIEQKNRATVAQAEAVLQEFQELLGAGHQPDSEPVRDQLDQVNTAVSDLADQVDTDDQAFQDWRASEAVAAETARQFDEAYATESQGITDPERLQQVQQMLVDEINMGVRERWLTSLPEAERAAVERRSDELGEMTQARRKLYQRAADISGRGLASPEQVSDGSDTDDQVADDDSEVPTRASRIIDLYQSGMSMREVAQEVGVSSSLVYQALKANKLPARPQSRRPSDTSERDDRIVSLYGEGADLKAVADQAGVSFKTVANVLERLGIERRSINGRISAPLSDLDPAVQAEVERLVNEEGLRGAHHIRQRVKDATDQAVSSNTITAYLRSVGAIDDQGRIVQASREDSFSYPDDVVQEIEKLYSTGLGSTAIADQLGLSAGQVRLAVQRAGIARTQSESASMALDRMPHPRGISSTWHSSKTGESSLAHSRWEVVRMSQLDNDPDVVTWTKRVDPIPYDNGRRRYVPDFLIVYTDGRQVVEEVKPSNQMKIMGNPEKWGAAVAYLAERNIEFRVVTEHQIGLSNIRDFDFNSSSSLPSEPGIDDWADDVDDFGEDFSGETRNHPTRADWPPQNPVVIPGGRLPKGTQMSELTWQDPGQRHRRIVISGPDGKRKELQVRTPGAIEARDPEYAAAISQAAEDIDLAALAKPVSDAVANLVQLLQQTKGPDGTPILSSSQGSELTGLVVGGVNLLGSSRANPNGPREIIINLHEIVGAHLASLRRRDPEGIFPQSQIGSPEFYQGLAIRVAMVVAHEVLHGVYNSQSGESHPEGVFEEGSDSSVLGLVLDRFLRSKSGEAFIQQFSKMLDGRYNGLYEQYVRIREATAHAVERAVSGSRGGSEPAATGDDGQPTGDSGDAGGLGVVEAVRPDVPERSGATSDVPIGNGDGDGIRAAVPAADGRTPRRVADPIEEAAARFDANADNPERQRRGIREDLKEFFEDGVGQVIHNGPSTAAEAADRRAVWVQEARAMGQEVHWVRDEEQAARDAARGDVRETWELRQGPDPAAPTPTSAGPAPRRVTLPRIDDAQEDEVVELLSQIVTGESIDPGVTAEQLQARVVEILSSVSAGAGLLRDIAERAAVDDVRYEESDEDDRKRLGMLYNQALTSLALQAAPPPPSTGRKPRQPRAPKPVVEPIPETVVNEAIGWLETLQNPIDSEEETDARDAIIELLGPHVENHTGLSDLLEIVADNAELTGRAHVENYANLRDLLIDALNGTPGFDPNQLRSPQTILRKNPDGERKGVGKDTPTAERYVSNQERVERITNKLKSMDPNSDEVAWIPLPDGQRGYYLKNGERIAYTAEDQAAALRLLLSGKLDVSKWPELQGIIDQFKGRVDVIIAADADGRPRMGVRPIDPEMDAFVVKVIRDEMEKAADADTAAANIHERLSIPGAHLISLYRAVEQMREGMEPEDSQRLDEIIGLVESIGPLSVLLRKPVKPNKTERDLPGQVTIRGLGVILRNALPGERAAQRRLELKLTELMRGMQEGTLTAAERHDLALTLGITPGAVDERILEIARAVNTDMDTRTEAVLIEHLKKAAITLIAQQRTRMRDVQAALKSGEITQSEADKLVDDLEESLELMELLGAVKKVGTSAARTLSILRQGMAIQVAEANWQRAKEFRESVALAQTAVEKLSQHYGGRLGAALRGEASGGTGLGTGNGTGDGAGDGVDPGSGDGTGSLSEEEVVTLQAHLKRFGAALEQMALAGLVDLSGYNRGWVVDPETGRRRAMTVLEGLDLDPEGTLKRLFEGRVRSLEQRQAHAAYERERRARIRAQQDEALAGSGNLENAEALETDDMVALIATGMHVPTLIESLGILAREEAAADRIKDPAARAARKEQIVSAREYTIGLFQDELVKRMKHNRASEAVRQRNMQLSEFEILINKLIGSYDTEETKRLAILLASDGTPETLAESVVRRTRDSHRTTVADQKAALAYWIGKAAEVERLYGASDPGFVAQMIAEIEDAIDALAEHPAISGAPGAVEDIRLQWLAARGGQGVRWVSQVIKRNVGQPINGSHPTTSQREAVDSEHFLRRYGELLTDVLSDPDNQDARDELDKALKPLLSVHNPLAAQVAVQIQSMLDMHDLQQEAKRLRKEVELRPTDPSVRMLALRSVTVIGEFIQQTDVLWLRERWAGEFYKAKELLERSIEQGATRLENKLLRDERDEYRKEATEIAKLLRKDPQDRDGLERRQQLLETMRNNGLVLQAADLGARLDRAIERGEDRIDAIDLRDQRAEFRREIAPLVRQLAKDPEDPEARAAFEDVVTRMKAAGLILQADAIERVLNIRTSSDADAVRAEGSDLTNEPDINKAAVNKIRSWIREVEKLGHNDRTGTAATLMAELYASLRPMGELGWETEALARERLIAAGLEKMGGKHAADAKRDFQQFMLTINPDEPASIGKALRYISHPTFAQYAREYGIINLLSSPSTWGPLGVNAISQLINSGLMMARWPAEYVADLLFSMGGKRRDRAIFGSEVLEGIPRAMRNPETWQGFKDAWDIMWTGHSTTEAMKAIKAGDVRELRTEHESTRGFLGIDNKVGRFLGQARHFFATRPLAALDAILSTILYSVNFEMQLERQIRQRKQTREQVLGNMDARIALMKKSGHIRDYTMSQNKSKGLRGWMRQVNDLTHSGRPDQTLLQKFGEIVFHLLVPFTTIAWNTTKQGIENSVIGTGWNSLRFGYREWNGEGSIETAIQSEARERNIDPLLIRNRQSDETRRRAADAAVTSAEVAGKAAVGASLALLALGLIMNGALTGDEPEDEDERATWVRLGIKPRSIWLGEHDKQGRRVWRSYDSTPVAIPFAMLATAMQRSKPIYQKMREAGAGEGLLTKGTAVVVAGGMGTVSAISHNFFLENLAELIALPFTAERLGWDGVASGLLSPLQNAFSGQIVPQSGLFRFFARMGDDFTRDTKDPDNLGWTMINRAQNALPGLRNMLPVKLDSHGEPIPDDLDPTLAAILGLKPGTTERPDLITSILREYGVDLEAAPPPSIPVGSGGSMKMTTDERRRFHQAYGQYVSEEVARTIGDGDGWDNVGGANATPAQRRMLQTQMLKTAKDAARERAGIDIWESLGPDNDARQAAAYARIRAQQEAQYGEYKNE